MVLFQPTSQAKRSSAFVSEVGLFPQSGSSMLLIHHFKKKIGRLIPVILLQAYLKKKRNGFYIV